MSFYTSLSGLQGAQTEMATISHNLANVSTNGFKKSTTQFADVIASTSSSYPTQMVGSGTAVKEVRQQFGQGGFTQSTSALDLAVSGDGFFVVKGSAANGNGIAYTRNGSFSVDASRTVVDAQGNALQVYPVDGSGAVVGSATTDLTLPATSGSPKATGSVTLALTLNKEAAVPADSAAFADTPYAFDRFDPATYNHATTTTIYDADGKAQTLTQYFVRDTKPSEGDASSSWTVHSFVGDQALSTTAEGSTPITLTFDASGKQTAPAAAISFAPFTPAGSATERTLTLDLSASQSAGAFTVKTNTQDGAAVGQFQSVAVGDDGTVRATFSNGDTKALGKVALAGFSNPAGLRQLGNSTWAASGLSGQPRMGSAGTSGFGDLMSGAVERSNVDITEELVALIAAQRNFQANAKALDTASQISQTIFNMRG